MFSIVVPAYNKQEFIGRTISSVLAQDYGDFELLVVDDGSSDATSARVLDFDDPRIVLVQQENRGEGGARNAGIARANRPWVVLLDADDYWFHDHLSELRRIINAFPDVGMVSTSFISGDEWQAPLPARRSSKIERIDYFRAAGREIGVVWSSTAAIRRDVSLAVGGFGNFRRGADQEYWVRTALRTPVAHSYRVTAYYYRHEGGVMASDHHRKEIAPDGIEEMWPSVAVIRSVQDDPSLRNRRSSLIAYERHATFLSIIGYLSRREFDVARRLARRLPGRRFDRAAAAAALTWLPDAVLSRLLDIKALTKSKNNLAN